MNPHLMSYINPHLPLKSMTNNRLTINTARLRCAQVPSLKTKSSVGSACSSLKRAAQASQRSWNCSPLKIHLLGFTSKGAIFREVKISEIRARHCLRLLTLVNSISGHHRLQWSVRPGSVPSKSYLYEPPAASRTRDATLASRKRRRKYRRRKTQRKKQTKRKKRN